MNDSQVSEIFKIFFTGLMICFLVGVFMWTSAAQQVGQFKQETNSIIQRSGGLTTDAINQINARSKDKFNNQIILVPSQSDTGAKSYGTEVDYVIEFRPNVTILNNLVPNNNNEVEDGNGNKYKPMFIQRYAGSATSMVRYGTR